MKLRMKLRKHAAALVTAAALTVIAVPVVVTAAPAYAGTGWQWCYEYSGQACLNAWGGGPWVKVETSRGLVNNDFTLVLNHAYNKYQLEFTGHGTSGLCIGDGNNDPNNGYAYLVPCGFTGGAGWGSLLDLGNCGSNYRCFKDDHWSSVQGRDDWIGPVNNYGNGSPFTLNNSTIDYFSIFNAA
jgi:hypothetical protein